jgi:hypothetical protein
MRRPILTLLPVANVRFAEPKSALLLRHDIAGLLELFPLRRVLERLIVFDKRRSRLTPDVPVRHPGL